MDLNKITKTLLDEISQLCDECKVCQNYLKELKTLPGEEHIRDRRIEELEDYISHIETHLKLNDRELVDVDFFSIIKPYFRRDSYEKKVIFIVQEGFDGEPNTKLTDDELKGFFTINNCLPLMRVVPEQLADNVRKYMPKGSKFTVELMVTPKKNFLTMTNIGPASKNEELLQILSKGGRGGNTSQVSGMGQGLRQVKSIIDLHQGWLDTSFSVSSSDKTIILNDTPHSEFIVKMSYMNGNSAVDQDLIERNFSEWAQDLPVILIHNMKIIITNLQLFCKDKLEKIPVADKSVPWRKPIYRLKVRIIRLADVLNQCLYATDAMDDNDFQLVLGNDCKVNLQKAVEATLRNLKEKAYRDKGIVFDTANLQRLRNINATSGFYSFLMGLFSLVIDDVPAHSTLQLTNESDNMGSSIVIACDDDDHDFRRTFCPEESDEVLYYRISMYQEMMDSWNGKIDINRNNIKLYFWNRK